MRVRVLRNIFAFVVFLDLPSAVVLTGAALATMVASQAFHAWDKRNSLWRSRSYKAFAAEFLDSVQGLGTLKAFGQSGARAKLLARAAVTCLEAPPKGACRGPRSPNPPTEPSRSEGRLAERGPSPGAGCPLRRFA